MKKIVLISIVAHAILLAVLAPYLKTRMEFDQAEEARRTEEVKKRELARQEYERLKREKQKLDEETAKKLKREAERQKREKIAREVEKLKKLRDEIMERQRKELAQIRQRQRQDVIAAAHVGFERKATEVQKHTEHFTGNAMRRALCVGSYQNGHDRGAMGFIDNIRIYLEALAPPLDSHAPAHRFPLDGSTADAVSGREGKLSRGGKLIDRPDGSPGQSFVGDGRNAMIQFWPIDFGDQFTLSADVNLSEKDPHAELPQLLFANTHSGTYLKGFRIYTEPLPDGAQATEITVETSGTEKGLKTTSVPGAFSLDTWHAVAVSIDKTAGTVRIFIDGVDVTAPEGKLAAETATEGSTIDGTAREEATSFADMIRENAPTPQSAAEIAADLDSLKERFAQRMEETPNMHDVRNEIGQATDAANEMQKMLAGLEAKTDMDTMNDTSQSVADKMEPNAGAKTPASPAELYNEAREIEQQIAEAYADITAAGKAATENTAYAEARDGTPANTPQRPDLAADLGGEQATPSTVGELNEMRQNLDRAANEVSDMNARAGNLLGSADNRAMASRNFPGSKFAAQTSRFAAASANHGYGAVVDMTSFGGSQSQGDSTGMRGDFSGEGADMTLSKKIGSLHLDEYAIMPKALPGRRFTEESDRQGWLYIDTWYVIGPWENESRVEFEVKHPPEYEVDFDAAYSDGKFADKEGHPDQILKWEFYQSDSVRCQPPSVYGAATYYAYTEVWFEQSRDMLIAVASDDAASVWLNDQIIWQDSGQSSWQLGEGYRRVHFRQGFNTMLVRIENGPVHCIWSVLLCPPEILDR